MRLTKEKLLKAISNRLILDGWGDINPDWFSPHLFNSDDTEYNHQKALHDLIEQVVLELNDDGRI